MTRSGVIAGVLMAVALLGAACSGSSPMSGDHTGGTTPSAGVSSSLSVRAATAQWYAGPAGRDLRKTLRIAVALPGYRPGSAAFGTACATLGPPAKAMLRDPSSPDARSESDFGLVAHLTSVAGDCTHHRPDAFRYDLGRATTNIRDLDTQLRSLGVVH